MIRFNETLIQHLSMPYTFPSCRFLFFPFITNKHVLLINTSLPTQDTTGTVTEILKILAKGNTKFPGKHTPPPRELSLHAYVCPYAYMSFRRLLSAGNFHLQRLSIPKSIFFFFVYIMIFHTYRFKRLHSRRSFTIFSLQFVISFLIKT